MQLTPSVKKFHSIKSKGFLFIPLEEVVEIPSAINKFEYSAHKITNQKLKKIRSNKMNEREKIALFVSTRMVEFSCRSRHHRLSGLIFHDYYYRVQSVN